jgi:hypothetical protein
LKLYYQINEEIEKQKIIKQKFNGKIVEDSTKLSGKSLGDFMSNLRKKRKFSRFYFIFFT